jgi:thioredoxin reductase (NADPH)
LLIRDLVIFGAGPAGLATAIAAQRAGLDFAIFEKGALVNSLLHFPTHMVFFTTAELLEIGGLPFVTPYEKPTRQEALRYYRRVVDACQLDVQLGTEVTALYVEDEEQGPFHERVFGVETRTAKGVRRVHHARTVVVAIGAYERPNLIGVPGEDLPHVHHYYKEPHPHYRQEVVVVGGKNSAAEAALELYRAGARVTLVHRRAHLGETIKYWVRPDIENRIKEGSIAARFETRLVEIRPTAVVVEGPVGREELKADTVFLMTGYQADTRVLSNAGVRFVGEHCVPEHDPETFETNVPGLFVAGTVVAGTQSGHVFIENGRFHGERVVEVIRGRLERTTNDEAE